MAWRGHHIQHGKNRHIRRGKEPCPPLLPHRKHITDGHLCSISSNFTITYTNNKSYYYPCRHPRASTWHEGAAPSSHRNHADSKTSLSARFKVFPLAPPITITTAHQLASSPPPSPGIPLPRHVENTHQTCSTWREGVAFALAQDGGFIFSLGIL